MDKNKLFRSIPKVDALLEKQEMKSLIERYGRHAVVAAIREKTDGIRSLINRTKDDALVMTEIENLTGRVAEHVQHMAKLHMCPVINATGTILHTNLGRAPISEAHAQEMLQLMTGYSNLEYDLAQGTRGARYDHFEELLTRLTGAEAALAVNNNAAAVLLVLSALARGGEVIVSRGELVEIGGKFRIPDVCAESGAALVEIGTTNKTHLFDYEEHMSEATKAILKVHTSNYSIVGFTSSVEVEALKPLAQAHDVPIIHDLGSGVLVDLERYGLPHEPTVSEAIAHGADVVCFSGDKLLGGPQAGIILGKKCYIDRIKKHPLTRALRIDKFTTAALMLTLREYLHEETVTEHIPVLRMIHESKASLTARAMKLKEALQGMDLQADFAVEGCMSQIGGGALPMAQLESAAVTILPKKLSLAELEARLRGAALPIIVRTMNDRIYMDLRTVETVYTDQILETLKEILS